MNLEKNVNFYEEGKSKNNKFFFIRKSPLNLYPEANGAYKYFRAKNRAVKIPIYICLKDGVNIHWNRFAWIFQSIHIGDQIRNMLERRWVSWHCHHHHTALSSHRKPNKLCCFPPSSSHPPYVSHHNSYSYRLIGL